MPLDIWPGRSIRITNTPLGQVSQDWRMTSVTVAFESSASRTYTIGYGGNTPAPSAMRRTGHFRWRRN